jgi:hypothetical protein
MEYEKSCVISSAPNDVSKAQTIFLSTVISKFATEAFDTLRRYLQTTADVKSVTNLLLRAQKFVEAGEAIAKRAMKEVDYREKQGMLGVRSILSQNSGYGIFFFPNITYFDRRRLPESFHSVKRLAFTNHVRMTTLNS